MTTAAELATRINATLDDNWHAPDHVVVRIHIMLRGDDVMCVTSKVHNEAGHEAERGLYGTILAFTNTRIVRANLKAARGNPSNYDRASVEVDVWARKGLERMTLPLDDAEGVIANADLAWDEPPNDLWPKAALLRLHYSSGQESLVPCEHDGGSTNRLEFFRLLPSLFEDLETR